MKFTKIPIPNDGHCAFYAFSIGLIVSIKYNGCTLPKKFCDELNTEFKSSKFKETVKKTIASSDFVGDASCI